MHEKRKEQRVIPFESAKLSTREASRIGLGLLFGFAGAMVSLLFGSGGKTAAVIVVVVFTAFGYFLLGKRIFKK
jgi:4-hydroxybenzoate polyprenyltransferase